MTGTSSTDRLLTGEEFLALGDIGPCELIDGRIVPMSPTGGEHGAIESLITARLLVFVEERKLGWVLGGEVGLYTRRNPDRVRGADVAFVSRGRMPRRPGRKFMEIAPELIVEVLSPEDRQKDLQQKLAEYFAIRVDRVWVVDPEDRSVIVYRSESDRQRLEEGDRVRGEGVLEGFELPVASLFAA